MLESPSLAPAPRRRALKRKNAASPAAGPRGNRYGRSGTTDTIGMDGTRGGVSSSWSRTAGASGLRAWRTGSDDFAQSTLGRTSGRSGYPESAVGESDGNSGDHGADGGEPLGFVCALIENRAREVGLASMHRRSLEFEITQFSDCGSYSRTCAAVCALEPSAVVMSRPARGTQLHKILEEALQSVGCCGPVLFAERRHFDETEGQVLLEQADVIGLQISEFEAKFVACAAFAALWCFAESSMECRLQAAAARVVYRGAADSMVIDASTARLLELVKNTYDHRERGSMFSLFSCRTPGGARLLRQSLLQPSAALGEIEARQAAVEALLEDESLFYELKQMLPALGDIDLLASRLTAEPKARGQCWCKAAVRTAVRLRQALTVLPMISSALEPSVRKGSSTLLAEARATLSHARFPELLQDLERVLDSDGPPLHNGGQSSMAHAALLYSVRTGVNALLDVARQTWNDALEQIHTLHRKYAVKYPELSIKLEFTERRGWYLSHSSQAATPKEFLQTHQKGVSARQMSTTREMNTENFKLRQAEREILAQTLTVLENLFASLRDEAALLYRTSHAASILDLIQALVGYTVLSGDCIRPQLTDDLVAPIAVKAGRHPSMERQGQGMPGMDRSFEPLDFFVGEACHFQVVTGPNGGGKSTYLQTLAQLVVLAQIGCFIPAEYATIRITSSLLTRIGVSDSLTANASTFLVEMQEAAHILNNVDPHSLVLIDELGRGTAHGDGLALCMSVCERLLETNTYTLFATHFYDICRLQTSFPGLRNMHLESKEENGNLRILVRHVKSLQELFAKAGAHYGIRAAAQAGMPDSLVARAQSLAEHVDARLQTHRAAAAQDATSVARAGESGTSAAAVDDEEALKTARQLVGLARQSNLTDAALADVLRKLQAPWLRKAIV